MMQIKNELASRLSLVAAATALVLQAASAEEQDEEIPFDVAEVYLELNNSDGDLGFHSLFDGDAWMRLELEDTRERDLLNISVRGRLRRQGLTELFYESAEPTFDELPPSRFFRRFPEGEYEVSAETLDGGELESVAELTHLLPAPPVITVSGQLLPGECEDDPLPVAQPFVVSWPAVALSHPVLGRTNEAIEIDRYQLVVEREEPTELKFSIDLPADITEVTLPMGLAASGEEFKVEVLVREESGNQTATETCFEVQ